jgi:hypothetical protein
MWLWMLSALLFFVGLTFVAQEVPVFESFWGFRHRRKGLLRVVSSLRELEETLMAGLVPDHRRWEQLRDLEEPWGRLSADNLGELRSSGGALLPTIQRLRALAEAHGLALEEAQSKSAQAFVQAGVCAVLVPVVGVFLYLLLPGVQQNQTTWALACGLALGMMLAGVGWLLRLSEAARWGGLPPAHRSWVLTSQCAGERFLALVRTGTPADLSWAKMGQFLNSESPALGMRWGGSIWDSPRVEFVGKAEELIVIAGLSIKKAVQVSLMEGRPCLDRVESVLEGLRHNLKSQVEREISLLGTYALQPLFICVAPSILGLLAFALWLSALDSTSGAWGDALGPF